jgi:hypothetical protein
MNSLESHPRIYSGGPVFGQSFTCSRVRLTFVLPFTSDLILLLTVWEWLIGLQLIELLIVVSCLVVGWGYSVYLL